MTSNEKFILYILGGIVLVMVMTQQATSALKLKISGQFGDIIQKASDRFGVPVERIQAHICVEDPKLDLTAVGSAGERGLMQLKPGALTDSKKVSHETFTFDQMFEAEPNIISGTAYLAWIEKYFYPGDWDKVSRAYNQGVGRANTPLAYAYLAKIKLAELA